IVMTTMELLLVFAVSGLILLQLSSKLDNSFSSINNYNREHLAFALANRKQITQKLDYAHFLPLTNNTRLHQVKVIVDYAPISASQYAFMKVYAPNGTLIKISSSPHGVNNVAPGKAQFATSLSASMIKQVTVHIMFTDSLRNANYSNPINVKLNLGQIISQS